MRIVSVLFTVFLTFLTSVILSESASQVELFSWVGIAVIATVVFLNVIKFIAWGWLNRRYDLSKTYPLTAMFFPLIFIYAVATGEAELTLQKVVGLGIILSGLYLMEVSKRKC
ncbi:hypothetical protein Q5H80_00895 [Vibrio sp. SNU_ST1]|uniref:hypothetical protein n=1 Tax=unclassified Vibrio TaxID=2614977 RepID=UPI0003614813|nr:MULTISPECIES: hypothetical protein [Vibrio]OEF72886.1 hypothetical protein A152_11535 [Vibrio tasmaniensis 1F-187]WKY58265.1 hypothetical protein Q5H80_00895 [Vibrio sp. SNU_ST1]